ncbi:unnamed protein product [Adineta ricciae]|uniref:G-protein coupled receptors family 1 profile domain-containing protein n=2 Tax=Adineta ricciae TaxID=249248 RepID=A0A814LC11_ADIRI|nr:unnamed protein product [Adineta ricciae]
MSRVLKFERLLLRLEKCSESIMYHDEMNSAVQQIKQATLLPRNRSSLSTGILSEYFRDVKCFYDETYVCLINSEQFPDCLQFNHELNNCTKRNYCQNHGRCLQWKRSSDINFICVRSKCTSGSFCQLKMEQFFLTFDSMLAEIIVLIFVIGLVSTILSYLTFLDPKLRKVGCGNYLLILSVFNQLTLIVFVLRFTYFIVSQMKTIENRQFLSTSCVILDFVLSLQIYMCDWLTVCISSERMINIIKGIQFNRRQSVVLTKFIVPLFISFVIVTLLHQPFTRMLIIDPQNDQRFWCVINFSSAQLEYYTIYTRNKQRAHNQQKHVAIMMKQIHRHKDLLISPLLIILLKMPSILMMIIIKCIQYKWQRYFSSAHKMAKLYLDEYPYQFGSTGSNGMNEFLMISRDEVPAKTPAHLLIRKAFPDMVAISTVVLGKRSVDFLRTTEFVRIPPSRIRS